MTLPIYVINLDRRPDRWSAISDDLNRIGLTAHRISAIDRLSLSQQTEEMSMAMGVGEEACLLSHCKALNEFLSSSHPAALILEDDAEVASDIPGCLQFIDWWPRNTGLLQLGLLAEKVRLIGPCIGQTPCGRRLYPILHRSGGSAGYLINRETAQIILNHCAEPPYRSGSCSVGQLSPMPIDHLMFNMYRSPLARRLKPVQVNPAMVRQKNSIFLSDITQSRDRAKRIRKISRKKAKRLNRSLHNIRIFGLRLIGKTNRIHVHYSDAHDLGKIV